MTKKKKSKHIKQKKHKKQVRHTKQTVQRSRNGQAKQKKQTKPIEQKSQTKQTSQRQKVKQAKQSKSEWKAVLYNCPYLLGIVFTSLLVMVWSDEIGFKAVAREAQTVMAQVSGAKDSDKSLLSKPEEMSQGDEAEHITANTEHVEKNAAVDMESEENAGERKRNNDDNKDESKLQNDIGIPANEENTGKSDEKIKGVTHFEIYEPQIIDSRYYSDAGKVALTTEYPYIKEDTQLF